MAQASLIQDGLDRFENVVKSVERDFKRLQKQADKRRKALEKRAERRVKKLQTELRKSTLVKRAGSLRDEAVRAVGDGVESLLGTLRIASHAEVERLERKVGQLGRKIRQLEQQLGDERAA
jgi:chromosome segregation ATPase